MYVHRPEGFFSAEMGIDCQPSGRFFLKTDIIFYAAVPSLCLVVVVTQGYRIVKQRLQLGLTKFPDQA